MAKIKRYKVTAKNIEYLMTNYIKAENIEEAKSIFSQKFDNGDVCVGSSEIQFQEIKREEIRDV
jgi:hypothetical protein